MKILDSLFKNMPAAQTAPTGLRTAEKTDTGTASALDAGSEAGGIVADLKEQGYVISSEEADRISEFIDSTDGTESEKLQTVKTALDKGLPITQRSLQSIKAALFEPALPRELQQLLADSDAGVSTDRADLIRAFAQLANMEEAGTAPHTETSAGISAETVEDKAVTWLLKAMEQVVQMSESLFSADEGSFVVESDDGDGTVKATHHKSGHKPELKGNNPESIIKDTEKESADEAFYIEETETDEITKAAGPSISEGVDSLITALKQQEVESAQSIGYDAPVEALIQGITVIMKEITPKMVAVKTEFETLRKTLRAELQAVQTELEKPVTANKTQVVEQLSQSIEKLDKTILKSDIPLYTSMKAEKQLLTWSSELQEARTLVAEGQNAKAAQIVERVSKGIEQIQFKPALLKVIHRTIQQAHTGDLSQEKGLKHRAQQQINRLLEPVHTPREVLEAFKNAGLTHDSEVVAALSQNSKKLKEDWQPQENLKEILMKLAADTQEKLTTVAGAEKALNNLTGQQLLSRPEAKPQGQTLFFSLPMEMANRVEDLKIYVQSRKDKGKVDWENCTFYFAVHTEKFGDVGIRFAAARKSVSIQVKCDNQTLREAVGPLVEDFKQTMQETGYKIAGISYSPLKESKAVVQKDEPPVETDTEGKGLNLKV